MKRLLTDLLTKPCGAPCGGGAISRTAETGGGAVVGGGGPLGGA